MPKTLRILDSYTEIELCTFKTSIYRMHIDHADFRWSLVCFRTETGQVLDMVQPYSAAEIAKLKKQTSRSIEIGDLSAAYCTAKLILNLLENNHSSSMERANVHYELGLICIALDKNAEGTRQLERAIECCLDTNNNDSWLHREATRALGEMEPSGSFKMQPKAKPQVQIA